MARGNRPGATMIWQRSQAHPNVSRRRPHNINAKHKRQLLDAPNFCGHGSVCCLSQMNCKPATQRDMSSLSHPLTPITAHRRRERKPRTACVRLDACVSVCERVCVSRVGCRQKKVSGGAIHLKAHLLHGTQRDG